MKRFLVAIGLIVAIFALCNCQLQSSSGASIVRFSLTNESVKLVEGVTPKEPISIVVQYETTDENDEASSVTLADGLLTDGELPLTRTVPEPTEVVISMKVGRTSNKAEATALLRPNATIDFAFIHNPFRSGVRSSLQILGKDQRSVDPKRRFSITGNLSELPDFKPELIHVSLFSTPSFLDGTRETKVFGSVLVDDGEFLIEGDLEEPTLFTIKIYEHPVFMGDVEYLHAILEPDVNYRIVPLGNNGELAVRADREDSLHTQLVTSWQFDPEYITLVDQWLDSTGNWQADRQEQLKHKEQFVNNYQVDDQCDHLSLTDTVRAEFVKPLPYSYQITGAEVVKKRSGSLRKILRDLQDPDVARLVFDLSWVQITDDEILSDSDADERIAVLLELAQKMDQDYVDRFITPLVETLQNKERLREKNYSLLPGQVAPKFTLKNITGDDVSLSDVLSENELVLVDFWASWCGPCIASFPVLKEMYAEYKDRGFEIVTISIDETLADWESASEEQKLPWIDLGDAEDGVMKGRFAPTASEYGVVEIPSKFLIDKKGCIVNKRISDDELKELLTSL